MKNIITYLTIVMALAFIVIGLAYPGDCHVHMPRGESWPAPCENFLDSHSKDKEHECEWEYLYISVKIDKKNPLKEFKPVEGEPFGVSSAGGYYPRIWLKRKVCE